MYSYKEMKPTVLTDEGQVKFLRVRDHVHKVLAESGAITLEKAMSTVHGDSWEAMACVDRLVELKEIKEIPQTNIPTQQKVYIKLF
jgi:hypothetical protein